MGYKNEKEYLSFDTAVAKELFIEVFFEKPYPDKCNLFDDDQIRLACHSASSAVEFVCKKYKINKSNNICLGTAATSQALLYHHPVKLNAVTRSVFLNLHNDQGQPEQNRDSLRKEFILHVVYTFLDIEEIAGAPGPIVEDLKQIIYSASGPLHAPYAELMTRYMALCNWYNWYLTHRS